MESLPYRSSLGARVMHVLPQGVVSLPCRSVPCVCVCVSFVSSICVSVVLSALHLWSFCTPAPSEQSIRFSRESRGEREFFIAFIHDMSFHLLIFTYELALFRL